MANALTPQEYVLIKDAIVEGALPPREIASKFERSSETISRVRKSRSFEEYVYKQRLATGRPLKDKAPVITETTEPDELIDRLRKEQADIYQQFENVINAIQRMKR